MAFGKWKTQQQDDKNHRPAQCTLLTRGPAGDFFMNFIFQEILLVSYIVEKLRTSAFQPCKKQILIVNLAENIRFFVLENFPR